MQPPATHRIVLVDDHRMIRQGLVQLLEDEPGFRVAGEAATAAEAHRVVEETDPDLVIADLVLEEGPDGIQLTKALKADRPFLPVLLLSGHDETLFAERAIAAGASGYLMKDEAIDVLYDAVRSVINGRIWLSGPMRARLSGASPRSLPEELGPRDRRLLEEMQHGNWTTHGLAKRLGMSWSEVERRRRELRGVLGFHSDVELVLFADSQRGAA